MINYEVILTTKRTTYNYNDKGLRTVEEINNVVKVNANKYLLEDGVFNFYNDTLVATFNPDAIIGIVEI